MSRRIDSPDTESDASLKLLLEQHEKSAFIMVAGAGSGKTTSLIKALDYLKNEYGSDYRSQCKKIACITYTEVAVKEILEDLGESELFHISTIHSFLWAVIRPFKTDIVNWMVSQINEKIIESQEHIAKPRTREATRAKLRLDIDRYRLQLPIVECVEEISYGTGGNFTEGILGHSDILKLVPQMIIDNVLLQKVIARKYPVILIDESQDTKPAFVDALKAIYETAETSFCLGFFGDPMQKIYMEGIGPINREVGWELIEKEENFRCPQSVLRVINNIRREDNDLQQTRGRMIQTVEGFESVEGSVNVFIFQQSEDNHSEIGSVREWLSQSRHDPLWGEDGGDIRMLVLVHKMAALRLNFNSIYSALNDNGATSLKHGLLDGTSWVLRDFLKTIIPIVDAKLRGDDFEVISILKNKSSLFLQARRYGLDISEVLNRLVEDVDYLVSTMSSEEGTIRDLLVYLHTRNTIDLDERYIPYLTNNIEEDNDQNGAVQAFLNCPTNEILQYKKYIEEGSPFVTQQGVKGAQFERVLLVINDDEGRYHAFSYGKLLGYTSLSDTDNANVESGTESVIERTRRLLYVCCSRAEKDLAIVIFVPNVQQAYDAVLATGYFEEDSIHTSLD
jgi:DNA helicase-2/ATP-dependent DNA helicase PcrA